jgi:hypothetical protein
VKTITVRIGLLEDGVSRNNNNNNNNNNNTAIELPLGGSSPYTSTAKTNRN